MPWGTIPGAVAPGGLNPFPQNAFPPTVRNSQWSQPRNLSGIPHSLTKWQAMPPGWDIADDYKYHEHLSPTETQADIVWYGPWTARFAFLDWVLGYSTSIFSSGSGLPVAISRSIPIQHPEMPWLYAIDADLIDCKGASIRSENSFALEFDNTYWLQQAPVTTPAPQPPQPPAVNPEGNPNFSKILLPMVAYANNGPAAYDDGLAYYRVRYEQLDFEVREDTDPNIATFGEICRHVSRERQYSLQALNLNAVASQQLKFTAGPFNGSVIPEGGALILPMEQLTYTWHEVPDIPDAGIAACMGTINAQAFDGVTSSIVVAAPGYPSYAIGSLLMQPPSIVRKRNKAGRVCWEIKYRFDRRYNVGGWNAFPAPDGNFYPAAFTSGRTVYQSQNWGQLFQAPSSVVYQ